jgi:drug/metabolite transporter (DMT)-like permease
MNQEIRAYFWGMLGIFGFGLTLPATKVAVPLFGFIAVGVGRAVIAGFLGLILLVLTNSKIPTRSQIYRLAIVASGVVFGFPLLSAYGMKYLPASHGAIVIAILPLLTALFGVILAKEKLSVRYWIAGIIGSMAIISYAISTGGGVLHLADLALVFAAIAAAIGYAEGARLASELGSWQTICYALVVVLPVSIILLFFNLEMNQVPNAIAAWVGLLYLSFISMFLAFFAWYRGLAMGGIAKIGQLQLLQPFITIGAAKIFFNEPFTNTMFFVLFVVLLSVYFGRKAQFKKAGG